MDSDRNIYRGGIDFAALALQDADWNKYVKINGQVNFADPAAVKQLTVSLLKRDFDLSIILPDDRLCPPVPNRLNYVLWLQDLVDQTSDRFDDAYDSNRPVIGFDIGTGASSIYPLLATSLRPRWRMIASDIDAQSHSFAARNISANRLESQIKLIPLSDPQGPLLPLDALQIDKIDFSMTNPPFYSSQAEMSEAARLKSRPPNSACTGADVEMVYRDGGEVGFVSRIILESYHLRDRVQWYSSMLGKLESLAVVVDRLRQKGCTNYAVAELVQGHKTRRWAIAWSWGNRRPKNKTARCVGAGVEKKLLPFPCEMTLAAGPDLELAKTKLLTKMASLDIQWTWKHELKMGIGFTAGNVWSRAARRRKAVARRQEDSTSMKDVRMHDDDDNDNEEDRNVQMHEGDDNGSHMAEADDHEPMTFGFTVTIRSAEAAKGAPRGSAAEYHVRWLLGYDVVVFESFCGMLGR